MKVEFTIKETRSIELVTPSFWRDGIRLYYVYEINGKPFYDTVANMGEFSSMTFAYGNIDIDFDKAIPVDQAEWDAALDRAITNIERSVNRLHPEVDAMYHLSRQLLPLKAN